MEQSVGNDTNEEKLQEGKPPQIEDQNSESIPDLKPNKLTEVYPCSSVISKILIKIEETTSTYNTNATIQSNCKLIISKTNLTHQIQNDYQNQDKEFHQKENIILDENILEDEIIKEKNGNEDFYSVIDSSQNKLPEVNEEDSKKEIKIPPIQKDLECSKPIEQENEDSGMEEISTLNPKKNIGEEIDIFQNHDQELEGGSDDLKNEAQPRLFLISEKNEINLIHAQTEEQKVLEADNKRRNKYLAIRKVSNILKKFHFYTDQSFRVHSKTIRFSVREVAKYIGIKIPTLYRYSKVIKNYFKNPILEKEFPINNHLDTNAYTFETMINSFQTSKHSQNKTKTSESFLTNSDLDSKFKYYNFIGLPITNH